MKKIFTVWMIVSISFLGLVSCESNLNEETFEIEKTDKGDGDIEEEDVVDPT